MNEALDVSLWSGPTVVHGPADGPLNTRLWQLPKGATVRLSPGTYRGPIALPRSVRLTAETLGTVSIEGSRGATLSVEGAERLALERLILRGPVRGQGAVLQQYQGCETVIAGCVLTKGKGRGEGGGGVDVQAGSLTIVRSRLTDHQAHQGGAVRASGPVYVKLRHCVIADCEATGLGGGAVATLNGASVELIGCTFANCAAASGSVALIDGGLGARASLSLNGCLLDGAISKQAFSRRRGGRLSVIETVLPWKLDEDSEELTCEGVLVRAVDLEGPGARRWAVKFPPLLDAIRASALVDDPDDVYGRSRERVWVGAVA